MNLSRRGYFVLAMAMLLAFCSVSALAQSSSSGTVQGQVTDQQGAAIPGVGIQLTEPSTNITIKGSTNDSGRFIITNVPPGIYTITFTKAGFSTRRVSKQDVQVGEIL